MDRIEQKEILKDLIEVANGVIDSLTSKKQWLADTVKQVEELGESLSEINGVDNFDEQDLIDSIINSLFESELEELYDIADGFRNDIDSYSLDLSEKRQEKLLERYQDLEDVCEKFNQSSYEYDDIDIAIEHIEEAIVMLKEMRK